MMRNITPQVADFDTIVGDDVSREILFLYSLFPSLWILTKDEEARIIQCGLKLHIVPHLSGINWPACANRDNGDIRIAADFLCLPSITRNEKLATILHEVGHIVNPPPSMKPENEPTPPDPTDQYLAIMKASEVQKAKPTDPSEFYADDYARHCDFGQALHSVFLKLDSIEPERIKRIEEDEPILRSFELNPRDQPNYPI